MVKSADVFKYGATKDCVGCKFVMGEVPYQCGHIADCKKRMLDLMENDIFDKHRVKQWYLLKGIDVEEIEPPPADSDIEPPEVTKDDIIFPTDVFRPPAPASANGS